MRKQIILIASFLFLFVGEAQAALDIHRAISIGPSLNWTFLSDSVEFSWGIEAAYWDFKYGQEKPQEVGLSLNAGIEFKSSRTLYFVEAQAGGVTLGVSAGPVYDTAKGWGFQSSIWANAFAGLSLRLRKIDELRFVPGVYLRLPLVLESSGSLA